MSWQGGVVLGLLFLSILFSRLIKSFPKDLVFTFAALCSALFGIVSSLEFYNAAVNQAILAMLGLWIIGKAFEQKGSFHPIGGLATAIGTPVNMIFLSLYSTAIPEGFLCFFPFLSFAILSILLSALLLAAFHKIFRKIFPEFLEVPVCAILPPDSLLVGKTREVIAAVRWKGWVALFLFLAAIIATFLEVAVGTSFFIAGLLLLLVRPFAIKKIFHEEFPLPMLLEAFSAMIFFFAVRNSGLSQWVASCIHHTSAFVFFTLCFLMTQIAAHFMPRPLAFSLLFSIALSRFANQPTQLFLAGANIAFAAAAAALFGVPKTDEIAISHGMSGRSPLKIRLAIHLILFAGIAIPSCLFWPFR